MWLLLLALTFRASMDEVPLDVWSCENQVEVWCAVDGCAAKQQNETTPMSIRASGAGKLSVCAYTGCWEGVSAPLDHNGRLVWTVDNAPFSSQPEGGFATDLTLLIDKKDGVGYVRAAGFATPVLCQISPTP